MPQLVLVHPQIPPNTGNIARTCAATDTELHLVGPLGFDIGDRYLKRAGLDYWPHVQLTFHPDLDFFLQEQARRGGRLLGYSVRGTSKYTEFTYQNDDWLLFGSETQGLPPELLQRCDATLTIPINKTHVRSLNLSVSAAIGLFEVRRQLAL
ncbi:tRNA (cytidine(34)-2'-O)-methyltransferase [Synechococcus moorigangaii CMS01]|nr:tRNA (cytidine(34)-2'-O)-methyltransferase [Synechococcus moorigangaii CMS01]